MSLARLAVCCPSLEFLEAGLQQGADLQQLVQMSALTRLDITGVTDTTIPALRHATSSLRELTITQPFVVTHQGLWHLVPLRQLTCLRVEGGIDDDGVECDHVELEAPLVSVLCVQAWLGFSAA
jgi:hypothetical protein